MSARLTKNDFINKSNIKHNNKYDYSHVEYTNNITKVKIICNEHGEFYQQPSSHMNGSGCPLCSSDKGGITLTTVDFIKKANIVHNKIYDYSKVIYKNNKTKVEIICNIHGSFHQIPNTHLNGSGCKMCRDEIFGNNTKLTLNQFISKSNVVHNNYYNYNKTEYKNIRSNVLISCPVHGDFFQNAQNHINGRGCTSCSKTGFDFSKTGSFYVQEIYNNDDELICYKIGITKNIKKRINNQKLKSKMNHKLIFEYSSIGYEIFQLEKTIKKNIECCYMNKSVFPDGYTETISPTQYDNLESLIIDFLSGGYNE